MWILKHRPELNRHNCLVGEWWQRDHTPLSFFSEVSAGWFSVGQFKMQHFREWLFSLKRPLNCLGCPMWHFFFFWTFWMCLRYSVNPENESRQLGTSHSLTCNGTISHSCSLHTWRDFRWGWTCAHGSIHQRRPQWWSSQIDLLWLKSATEPNSVISDT